MNLNIVTMLEFKIQTLTIPFLVKRFNCLEELDYSVLKIYFVILASFSILEVWYDLAQNTKFCQNWDFNSKTFFVKISILGLKRYTLHWKTILKIENDFENFWFCKNKSCFPSWEHCFVYLFSPEHQDAASCFVDHQL